MKGQLFSFDLMVSVVVFMFTIGVIGFIWFTLPMRPNLLIQEKANTVADYLVTSRLGDENFLGCDKIASLNLNDYSTIRKELGTGEFDLFVEFKNSSMVCAGNQINIGTEVINSNRAVSVVRIVKLDNQKMQMIVRLYA
jgi:hypothetical protein